MENMLHIIEGPRIEEKIQYPNMPRKNPAWYYEESLAVSVNIHLCAMLLVSIL